LTRTKWPVGLVFLVPVVVGLGVALYVRVAKPPVGRTPDQNILLVTLDTLRADVLGTYGGRVPTPRLDALAADGVRFEFAHAHAVMTLPSHASILTGRYPFEHGIRDNSGYRLSRATPTLATLLKPHGYATGAFVSAFPLDSRYGLDAGFDAYDDRLAQARGPSDFSMPERPGPETIDAATQWINAQHGRWFAWVHLFEPHAPYAPAAPFDRAYAQRPYDGEAAYTDDLLGRLVDVVRRTATRPTLIVVTADHGEGLGEHGELTHGLFAYETTLRVPLVIAQHDPRKTTSDVLPGFSRASQVSGVPARHIDLVPTILDALTLARPDGLSGMSLLQATDRDEAASRASYFEAMSASINRGWAPLSGVLMGRDKYIDLPLPELYDLISDPAESSNLVDGAGDKRRTLEARLRAFAAKPPGARETESAEAQARLRALGYVSGSAPRRSTYTEADDPKRLADIDRMIHEAIDLHERGRSQEAIAKYREVIARRPDMAIAYRHLAFIQWELGEVPAAVHTLREAIARGAGDASTRTQLGTYLAETGNPREAIVLLDASAGRDFSPAGPADPDTLNALGIAYARAGQPDRALRTFEAILRTDAANAMAMQNIGSVHLAAGRNAEAEKALQRAVEIDDALTAAWTALGVAQLRRGDRAAAIESWKRATALDPREFNALYNLGTELLNAGAPEQARPYLERFAATAPPALFGPDVARVRRLLEQYNR